MTPRKSLFDISGPGANLHSRFKALASEPGYEPARWMMEDVFASFVDGDGNFLEQFQTTGFDQRVFELYLYAYFARSGFEVNQGHSAPDFIITAEGTSVAVEATTVNPSLEGVLARVGRSIADLSEADIQEYQRHELAVRFGGPLFTKLKKKYWKLPQCKGMPIVLAIQAFHDPESLGMSDSALSGYIFGVASRAEHDSQGKLTVEFERLLEHAIGEKVIPSSFFDLEGAENISAVLFSNVGTVAKFSRMGFQAGVANDKIAMMRMGYSLNHSPDALDPTFFHYSLDAPPSVEMWGEGVVVMLNPRAIHPLPNLFFPYAAQEIWEGDHVSSIAPPWHPYSSKTVHVFLGELKQQLLKASPGFGAPVAVGAIEKSDFKRLARFPDPGGTLREVGWYADESDGFIGVVLHDEADGTWGLVVLARDQHFQFRAIDMDSDYPSRRSAVRELQYRMAQLAAHPQRVFHQ